jgi:hypothetical protein
MRVVERLAIGAGSLVFGRRSMSARLPRERYPWWVKLGLWGVPGRAGAWAFVAVSVLLAVGCVAYAVLSDDPRL